MKKILSVVAFVAMLCVPFSFVSCGDDDPVVPPQPEKVLYSLSYTINGDLETSLTIVHDFLVEKLGRDVTIEGNGLLGYFLYVDSKEKGDALFKGLAKYEDELDKLLQENDKLSYLRFTIRYGSDTIYTYEYPRGGGDVAEVAGTYTYAEPDKEGAVWSVTFTDESADEDGYMPGELVIPYDVNGAKAGSYKGIYKVLPQGTRFQTDQMMEGTEATPMARVTLYHLDATEEGIPTSVTVNTASVFKAEDGTSKRVMFKQEK